MMKFPRDPAELLLWAMCGGFALVIAAIFMRFAYEILTGTGPTP